MLAFVNEQRHDLFARKILKNSTTDFGFKPFTEGHNFSLTCLKMLARDKQRGTEQNVRCWVFCSLGKNSEKPKRGVGNQRLPTPPSLVLQGRVVKSWVKTTQG